ncbi:hypothetical protein [Enterococcus hulanensis]|uniref:hypothetical protein n=1 Tax=Enterococcus hulanensis TaxID=2559929 RepID=UPI0010F7CAB8|nr:hypothetical protein [Enterococcus hulanensis]
MVKRTKKEFQDYNDFHDRPFGLKWGTAYAMDDLMKGVRANEEYALKSNAAKPLMSREEIDICLSESFLKHKEIALQLNIVDEFGRLIDEQFGYFSGEAYQDYFVFENQKIDWQDVRNVEIIDKSKWFEIDMFEQPKKTLSNTEKKTDPEIQLEKDREFYQPFYEEGEHYESE